MDGQTDTKIYRQIDKFVMEVDKLIEGERVYKMTIIGEAREERLV